MSKPFKLSQSKANTYRRCRRAYWFKYVQKLRRKLKARPLQFGTMVHEMLEGDANGKNPFKILKRMAKTDEKMFRSQAEEWGQIVDDTRVIMTEYFIHWDHAPKDKRIEPITIKKKTAEHTFEVEIAKDIVATGKIDMFAKTPNKLRWLVEHKTFARMPNEDHRWRNLQSVVYFRVNDMLGLPSLDGTCWDYIRSKPPTAPQFKQDGTLSARALDTLPTKVLEAFKEAGIKATDKKYAPLIKLAEANRRNYFDRVFTPIKEDVVDVVWEDFIHTAKEMADNHGRVKDRHIGRHCDWCEFESLCRAEMMGMDADFIRSKDFEIREKHDEEEPDFEA